MKRLIAIVAFAILTLSLSVLPSASAQNTTGTPIKYTRHLTKIKAGTNTACHKGQSKMFIVTAQLPSGQQFTKLAKFNLRLKSGKIVHSRAQHLLTPRIAEYDIYVARTAKVSGKLAKSSTTFTSSTKVTWTATVRKLCFS